MNDRDRYRAWQQLTNEQRDEARHIVRSCKRDCVCANAWDAECVYQQIYKPMTEPDNDNAL